MVEKLYGRHYSITCIYATTDDVGHSGTSRSRVYLVLVHKSMAKMTRDINQLYSKLAARLRSMVHTRPSDYMVAEPWEVQLEVAALAELRAKQNQRAVAAGPQSVTRRALYFSCTFGNEISDFNATIV